jgi:hypothetical protein
MGCAECGGVLGINGGKQAIFATGLYGHNSCHQVCPACWKAIRELGGPGPNIRAQEGRTAGAAAARIKAARGY